MSAETTLFTRDRKIESIWFQVNKRRSSAFVSLCWTSPIGRHRSHGLRLGRGGCPVERIGLVKQLPPSPLDNLVLELLPLCIEPTQ